jgi:hypothetical protein
MEPALTHSNHRVTTDTCQHQTPMWIILHGGVGSQRRRWGADLARLADDLVATYGWVMWREGDEAHLKHRSMMPH